MDVTFSPQPKPTKTRKQLKAQRDRLEDRVIRDVRAKVMARDLVCRAGGSGSRCVGDLLMAHMQGFRRAQTRGMAPERRHDTRWCLALCASHGAEEEARRMRVIYLSNDGCDGPVSWEFHP